MSVLLLLPPMMNSTLLCASQCLKQIAATDFIFSYGGLPPKSLLMIASSPSISVTSELAPPPKVGARIVPLALIT